MTQLDPDQGAGTRPPGISRKMADDVLRQQIIERGWRPGTTLENQVAWILSRFGTPRPEQQHRAGKYRLDFAWPAARIALEADGWWHRSPDGASKDRQRDSWLRSEGWLVFRVDDEHGDELLEHQVMRVCRVVRTELQSGMRERDWIPHSKRGR